jgi:phage shock protein E
MQIITLLALISLITLSSCKKTPTQNAADTAAAAAADTAADTHQHIWVVKPVNSTAVMEIITHNPQINILDIRTPAEFAKGHIKGAINVDFKAPDFAKNIAKLNNHRTYILHCRSGNRSKKSLKLLKENNFGTIYHFEGGFNEWQASGQPVEK